MKRMIGAAVAVSLVSAARAYGVSCSERVSLTGTNSYEETVSGWTTNCWPFAPTVCYGGNRFRVVPQKYPPYLLESSPDMPVTMAPSVVRPITTAPAFPIRNCAA